ncbi:uncharacterized protein LOC135074189 [Ostrinia nubilalis]|uniref:uncharacterized protein LOC135074189 n=1 Tax=Ostrinia nubilalis TaxID=29057 RepID=UPI00308231F9
MVGRCACLGRQVSTEAFLKAAARAQITECLSTFRVLLADYLRDREVLYVNRDGQLKRRGVASGVPQGSVLGPLLWNLGFNWLLRGVLLAGMSVICYADDTLVTARGKTFGAAARLASAGGKLVGRRIRRLGLKVALEKTEALFLPGPRQRTPPDAHIVPTLQLASATPPQGSWRTELAPPEFERATNEVSSTLCRRSEEHGAVWRPNLGGRTQQEEEYCRSAQAPAGHSAESRKDLPHGRARCVLAGTPPWELEAGVLSVIYHWMADQKARGKRPAPERRGAVRQEEREIMIDRWKEDMTRAQLGCRTLDAIGPVLDQWLERMHGFLTFRLAQVLTGHGCFCSYLHRIGRDESPLYHKCGAADDTVQHTLAVCTGWEEQRHVLTAVVGRDL